MYEDKYKNKGIAKLEELDVFLNLLADLNEPIELFAIGGTAMVLKKIKESTKDIDFLTTEKYANPVIIVPESDMPLQIKKMKKQPIYDTQCANPDKPISYIDLPVETRTVNIGDPGVTYDFQNKCYYVELTEDGCKAKMTEAIKNKIKEKNTEHQFAAIKSIDESFEEIIDDTPHSIYSLIMLEKRYDFVDI